MIKLQTSPAICSSVQPCRRDSRSQLDQEVADGVPVAFVVTGKHSDSQLIMDARQREPSVVRERNFEDHNLPL